MLSRILRRFRSQSDLDALWHRCVAIAREPHWYATRGVADTLEGRFDMVTAITALVLIRLDQDGDAEAAARLTELFIEDMDGQLRESGVGDLMVGKRMGSLVSALGGRMGAYRDGLSREDGTLAEAVKRNVTLLDEGDDGERVATGLRETAARIGAVTPQQVLAGDIA